jgi:hypothetical protein
MKKVFSVSILISLLTFSLMPAVAFAQIKDSCDISYTNLERIDGIAPDLTCDSPCSYSDTESDCGMCCLLNTLMNITDWLFIILIVIVILFVLLGAFTLLTAAGAPERVASGRNYILFAAIGLAVAFLARAVPNIVGMIAG